MPEKDNALRRLRIEKQIPAKAMVEIVKTIYPKYDKTVQSKAENTEAYGVILAPDAMRLLQRTFVPELEKPVESKKHGQHRLTCRISCRLQDSVYEQLQHAMNASGYHTMQDFLTALVKEHLERAGEEQEGTA